MYSRDINNHIELFSCCNCGGNKAASRHNAQCNDSCLISPHPQFLLSFSVPPHADTRCYNSLTSMRVPCEQCGFSKYWCQSCIITKWAGDAARNPSRCSTGATVLMGLLCQLSHKSKGFVERKKEKSQYINKIN